MDDLKPSRVSLKIFFESLKAEIPDYQRGYSWENDQINDFLNDLNDERKRTKDSEYFFGPIIVVNSNDGVKKIIDGQQRISTVTIFFAVVRDLLVSLHENALSDSSDVVHEIVHGLVGDASEEGSLKLVQRGQGADYFKTEIQTPKDFKNIDNVVSKKMTKKKGVKPTQNTIAKAYNQILKYCKEGYSSKKDVSTLKTKIIQLYKTLLNKFFIIEIPNNDVLSAFQIFQALNARGKNLTAADLIKSYFFGKNGSLQDSTEIKNNWEEAQRNLQTEDLTDFLRYLWNSEYDFATKRNLYRQVSEKFQDIQSILKFSKEIKKLSVTFAQMNSSENIDELNDRIGNRSGTIIKELATLNFHSYFPIVLSLTRDNFDKASFETVMKLVQNILIRNKILGNGTNWLEKIFSAYAKKINNISSDEKGPELRGNIDKLINDLQKETIDSKLDTPRVKDALSDFDFSKDIKFAKTILRIIENNYYPLKEQSPLSTNNSLIHLEHIMPKIPNKMEDWGMDKNTSTNDPVFQSFLWRLGNLTLWYGPDNSSLQNSSYKRKREGDGSQHNGYKDSTVRLTKELWLDSRYQTWNKENIEKRTEDLVSRFINL